MHKSNYLTNKFCIFSLLRICFANIILIRYARTGIIFENTEFKVNIAAALLKRRKRICYNLSMRKKCAALIFVTLLAAVLAALSACKSDITNIAFGVQSAEVYLSDGNADGLVYAPEVITSPRGGEYALSSSNPSIVKVNPDNVSLTAVREGSVVITATSSNGLTASMRLNVLGRRASGLGGDSADGYTVSFVSPYGSAAAQIVAAGETASDPGEIQGAPSGYELYGWYTESDYINRYDFSTPVNSNLVLWALWGAADPLFLYSESDGKTYITGFRYQNIPYKEVEIPAVTETGTPVYGIREAAFAENDTLEKVSIADGISFIDKYAFSQCASLTEVVIPASVVSIGENAFNGCEKLVSFTAEGNGLNSIGNSCFAGCSALESVTLPDSLGSLGEYAFDSASSLKNIVLPVSLAVLQRGVFRYSGLVSIDLSHVTDIYNEAFWGAVNLETVTGAENLTNVGSFTFGRLGTNAATKYLADISNYEDGLLYLGSALIYAYPVVTRGDYVVKNGTTVIAGQAFEDVPSGTVTFRAAAAEAVPDYGTYAFGQKSVQGSDEIQPALDIIVPKGTTKLYIDKWLTATKDSENYDVPTVYSFRLAQNIYERAYIYDSLTVYSRTPFKEFTSGVYFDKDSAAETGKLSDGITFDETKVNYIVASYSETNTVVLDLYTILNGNGKSVLIDDILPFAFDKLDKLETVILTNHIGSIGSFAFTDCPALKEVRFANETVNVSSFSTATITNTSFNRSTLNSKFVIYAPATLISGSSSPLYSRYRTDWKNYLDSKIILPYNP